MKSKLVMTVVATCAVLGTLALPAQAVPEVEPPNVSLQNDAIAVAEALGAVGPVPLVVDGFISTADANDVDYYSFTATKDQFVAIGISRGDGRVGSTDDVDTELALFRGDAVLLAHDDDTIGNDPLIANFRIPADGTYFIAVSANDNEPVALSQPLITLTELLLGGDLVTGATSDASYTFAGSDSGDYTLTIRDANTLLCVAHSVEEGHHGNLPFDAGRRKANIYNGAPLAEIGIHGFWISAGEGDFDTRSATFGPDRDPNGVIHFSVSSGNASADLPGTATEAEQGQGMRANDVFRSTRNGSNELAFEGWTLGYTPDSGGEMDALILGCATDKMFPVFDGDTIVAFVHDHSFPLYFTIDDDGFENGDADILIAETAASAPHIFKWAAELGLDENDEIDGLVKVVGGFLFSLDKDNATGLPGSAVRAESDAGGDFAGTNVYFTACDGTNTLFIAGADLGFGPGGEIDALDIPFDPPPPPTSGTGVQGPPGPPGPAGEPASAPPGGQAAPGTPQPFLGFIPASPFFLPVCGVGLLLFVPAAMLGLVAIRRRRRFRR